MKPIYVALKDQYPEIRDWWDPELNNNTEFDNAVFKQTDTVTLRCPQDARHIFQRRAYILYKKDGTVGVCPYCTHQLVLPGEDLFSVFPKAKEMWDFEKNKDIFPDTSLINPTAAKHAYFKCENGHSFRRYVYRFLEYQGCPDCKRGVPKIKTTVAEVPHLAKQWDKKRNGRPATEAYARSKEKAYWKCPDCGYEWSSEILSRFTSKGECPCCETRVVVVPGINDLFTELPELRAFFDEDNNKGIDANTLTVTMSNLSVNWKCPTCGYK